MGAGRFARRRAGGPAAAEPPGDSMEPPAPGAGRDRHRRPDYQHGPDHAAPGNQRRPRGTWLGQPPRKSRPSPGVHGGRRERAFRRNTMADRFPSPFEMPTPPGAEGWQDLYAYSTVFSEDRREYEDATFWFMDGVHTPEVIPPWDATILEFAIIGLSQYNTRHYVIP